MVESLILFLIYVGLLCAALWLVIWALGQFGVPLPPQVIKCLWIVLALICILLLWRAIGPALSTGHLPSVR